MENNTFATKDLHFAAFLKIHGTELKELKRHESEFKDRKPVYFIFKDKESCEHLEQVFWNGVGEEIMINAKEYVDAIRDLRTRTSSVGGL